ncbi:MFS transporter, partial [Mycobacterium alsense]|uniref:MFS transporter n=1 Tax=Mycobacterium alsense TaxID=324058 RepID=UPI003BF8A361
ATGWSAFGLRVALVPLFVTDVMGRGIGIIGIALAAFAGGNAVAMIPSGYLSDRMGRRTLMIVGLALSGAATIFLGAAASLPTFLAAAHDVGDEQRDQGDAKAERRPTGREVGSQR